VDELIDQDDGQVPNNLNGSPNQNANDLVGNNIQNVGFVKLIQSNADLVFMSKQLQLPQPKSDFFKHNPEAIRLGPNVLHQALELLQFTFK
jgi:hypothetical protein